ncbi:hypothetical protein FHS29_001861 [Saccharothrix tamanrassetensis]|uniref:Uncharacterized protein n=1 Tax=Saccharothrix tamanrassetensis TaxID=1051531 RepID=A0A841CE61_9PSEU|nr:hypothetical protein [Saccharothrix tamanrassetensis]MBB5955280.1 hypothetical protein [Saccharothrix tamanrassetensis]
MSWAAVLLDGFGLVALGTVLPVLLQDKEWRLTPASASGAVVRRVGGGVGVAERPVVG